MVRREGVREGGTGGLKADVLLEISWTRWGEGRRGEGGWGKR